MDQKENFLLTLTDRDVFSNPMETNTNEQDWEQRLTGKVVLLNDENKIALIGNNVNNFFLLPGGGIESEEALLDGVFREVREETGCEIKITHELGTTEDFRNRDNRHVITHGYLATVVSQSNPNFTKNEIDVGAYATWISLEESERLLENQKKKVEEGKVEFYNTCFNTIRDLLFIKKAKEILNS